MANTYKCECGYLKLTGIKTCPICKRQYDFDEEERENKFGNKIKGLDRSSLSDGTLKLNTSKSTNENNDEPGCGCFLLACFGIWFALVVGVGTIIEKTGYDIQMDVDLYNRYHPDVPEREQNDKNSSIDEAKRRRNTEEDNLVRKEEMASRLRQEMQTTFNNRSTVCNEETRLWDEMKSTPTKAQSPEYQAQRTMLKMQCKMLDERYNKLSEKHNYLMYGSK